jgi:hypothetical protein
MARRPHVRSEAKLSIAELEEYRLKLASLTRNEAEREYTATHNACRLDAGRVPSPKLIQELVQAWKRLRSGKSSAGAM